MKIVKCDQTNQIIMTWAVQSDTFFDSCLTQFGAIKIDHKHISIDLLGNAN